MDSFASALLAYTKEPRFEPARKAWFPQHLLDWKTTNDRARGFDDDEVFFEEPQAQPQTSREIYAAGDQGLLPPPPLPRSHGTPSAGFHVSIPPPTSGLNSSRLRQHAQRRGSAYLTPSHLPASRSQRLPHPGFGPPPSFGSHGRGPFVLPPLQSSNTFPAPRNTHQGHHSTAQLQALFAAHYAESSSAQSRSQTQSAGPSFGRSPLSAPQSPPPPPSPPPTNGLNTAAQNDDTITSPVKLSYGRHSVAFIPVTAVKRTESPEKPTEAGAEQETVVAVIVEPDVAESEDVRQPAMGPAVNGGRVSAMDCQSGADIVTPSQYSE